MLRPVSSPSQFRVDHTTGDPIAELERLYNAAVAYRHLNRGVDTIMGGDARGAVRETDEGLELLPGDGNLRFLRAGALLVAGDVEGGTAELQGLLRERPSWATVVRSFHERSLMVLPPGVDLDTILGG